MIHRPMRFIAFLLIETIGIVMAVKLGSLSRAAVELAACTLFGLGFLALTKTRQMALWADAAVLYGSALLLLGLMLLDERPLLPGILFFLLIPATTRMPLFLRVSAYLSAVVSLACVYMARELYLTIDPIVPVCQAACIAALTAFTEAARHQSQSVEENTKLLEGLIAAQRQIAQTEERVQLLGVKKSMGELLATAALQIEGAKELWPTDQTRAAQLSYKAEETIRQALDRLRDVSPAPHPELAARPARVLVAHENSDMIEGLKVVIETDQDLSVVATATDAEELIKTPQPYDLALIQEDLPKGGWSTVMQQDGAHRCLILSALPGSGLRAEVLEKGALGVLDSGAPAAEILATIRGAALEGRQAQPQVSDGAGPGKGDFTARELQILALIAKGFSNKEISERLFLAEGTVKNRVTTILQKIGARNRGNAALRARELGLI